MKKYRYQIINLDCPNCAKKIEEYFDKDKHFNNVIINFSTKKLSFESDKEVSLNEINRMVKSIEDSIVVIDNSIKVNKEYHWEILLIAVIIGLLGLFLPVKNLISSILIIISYILLLYRPFINAVKTLIKNHTINENLLITISCIGAYLIGEIFEGLMVVILYSIGKILEEKAVNKTRSSIKNIMDLKEEIANLKKDNEIIKIKVDEIKIGDILVIKKGEKVPVDGIIINGNTKVDTSMLTGESELLEIKSNDKILAGYINAGNVFEMTASKIYEESMVAKILELVETATDKKASLETTVSKFSKIYTPIVLILAILTTLLMLLFTNLSFNECLYRGLTFLVISCPCAFAISLPLSYFTGIGVSSSNGILVKGSNYLDNLSNIKKIIFDKTGTLTNGTFEVSDFKIDDNSYKKQEIIDLIRQGENLSNHPISNSILKLSNKKIDSSKVYDYKEISGKGIKYKVNDKLVKIGNKNMCKNCNIDTDIHVNINGIHVASIIINDGIKENAKDTIDILNNYGIDTYMFTGDKEKVAYEIAKRLNIKNIKAEMLPDEKYNEYLKIKEEDNITSFVGDGINDAIVLKGSDIGISMGGIGSFQAIESSDVVLMNDDLSKLITGINISKFTKYIIKQNLLFAGLVKSSILILNIFGLANMWLAVFADTGVTVLTILNTLRIRNRKY